MKTITVVGLGNTPTDLTLGCIEALKNTKVFLRTEHIPVASALRDMGIVFEPLDRLYEQSTDFTELDTAIADTLLSCPDDCVYAVTGSGVEDSVLTLLINSEDVQLKILGGVSRCVQVAAACGCTEGYRTYAASSEQLPDVRLATIITDIDSKLTAGQLKIVLNEYYPDEHKVTYFGTDSPLGRSIPLYEMDRQDDYGYNASVYVPALGFGQVERYDLEHLVEIMARLRSPGGCPWDREQTHASIRANMLEEAYEVAEAIDRDDPDMLCDELGDVLLQVIFHARMSQEQGEFMHRDVTTAVCRKLIRRHPHIFGDVSVSGSEEVLHNWDQIKKQEKEISSPSEVLEAVSKALPALVRGQKLLKKAVQHAISAPSMDESAHRIAELIAVLAADMPKEVAEQTIGQALFELTNLARLAGVAPEEALQHACDAYIAQVHAQE